jgi:putative PIN family toxin of toxin-antitoxin system
MGKKEKEVRVVLDTNVMVSALLFQGRLSKIVDLWKEGKIVPLLSRDTFNELKTVLEYPKFSLTAGEIKNIIEDEVLPFFEIVEEAGKIGRICRDAEDDKFIVCAVSGAADFIISGDNDLLDIGKYKSIKIINASELLKKFG